MKNEERILELLAETLQRIDRHSEIIERQQEEIKQQGKHMDEQREQIRMMIAQMQKHQERLEKNDEAFVRAYGAIGDLKERTEAIQQSSLEQQKAYQAMTELLMHHNYALREKGIL